MQRKRKIAVLLLPIVAIGAFWLVKTLYAAWVMPWMPPCMLRTLTGFRCPSCGMTHSVFALCRGDLWGALRENAVIPVAALLAVLWYVERVLRVFGHPKKIIPRNRIVWIAVLGMTVCYWIGRNLIG